MVTKNWASCVLFVMVIMTTANGQDEEECTCLNAPSLNGGLCGCYGDILSVVLTANNDTDQCMRMNGHCTGVNARCVGTRLPDGLCGHKVARKCCVRAGSKNNERPSAWHDYSIARLPPYRQCFERLAVKYCFHHALLGAWAWEETRIGRLNDENGFTSEGRYGLLGCNVLEAPGCEQFAWDSCEYVEFMLEYFLARYYGSVQFHHPDWTPEMKLRAAFAAYNGGLDAIINLDDFDDVDESTTNDEYSYLVMLRAQQLASFPGDAGWRCEPSPPLAEDIPCLSREGQCKNVKARCKGNFWPGLCGGRDAGRKCCIPNSKPKDIECVREGGMCREKTSQCPSGQFWGKKGCGQVAGGADRLCCKPGSQPEDLPCIQMRGQCKNVNARCPRGKFVDGLCGGESTTRKCCVREVNRDDKQCQAQNGDCLVPATSNCTGQFWNKCAGGKKCCISGSTPTDAACIFNGGICQPVGPGTVCPGGYSDDKCSGNGRKCCLPSNEKGTDIPCVNLMKGSCQPADEDCDGFYMPGPLCENAPSRQCCLPLSVSPISCQPSSCQNGGLCAVVRGKPKCSCPPGFVGRRCETAAPQSSMAAIESCNPNPCQNNGTCRSVFGALVCRCQLGFRGTRCELAGFGASTESQGGGRGGGRGDGTGSGGGGSGGGGGKKEGGQKGEGGGNRGGGRGGGGSKKERGGQGKK